MFDTNRCSVIKAGGEIGIFTGVRSIEDAFPSAFFQSTHLLKEAFRLPVIDAFLDVRDVGHRPVAPHARNSGSCTAGINASRPGECVTADSKI